MAGFRLGEFGFSGTYYIAIEDSSTPDIFVKFTGFNSPEQAGVFIHALESILESPLDFEEFNGTLH